MEKKIYELIIDPELRDYIPALPEDVSLSLEQQIIEQGCMEPLTVWDKVIVDGHNRYRICREHNIPFAINEVSFPDKAHAMKWMADRQIGRRNLNPYQRCELVYPLEGVFKEEIQNRKKQIISYQRKGMEIPPNLAGPQTTRDVMAQKACVSHGTWDMAKALISEAPEDIKKELRAEKLAISKAYSILYPKKAKKKTEAKDAKVQAKDKDDEVRPEAEARNNEVWPEAEARDSEVWVDVKDNETREVVEKTGEIAEPVAQLREPIEVPSMRDNNNDPRPFEYVRDQVRFSIENMLKELKIGLNWLREEDVGKADELVAMLKDGYDRATRMLKEVG